MPRQPVATFRQETARRATAFEVTTLAISEPYGNRSVASLRIPGDAIRHPLRRAFAGLPRGAYALAGRPAICAAETVSLVPATPGPA